MNILSVLLEHVILGKKVCHCRGLSVCLFKLHETKFNLYFYVNLHKHSCLFYLNQFPCFFEIITWTRNNKYKFYGSIFPWMTKAVGIFSVSLDNDHRQKIPQPTKPTHIIDFFNIIWLEITLKQILYMSSHNKNYI